MLPSRSWILAEAINTKILTKNQLIPHISNIPTTIPRIPTLIPHIPTLIPCVPTLIPRVFTLIPRVPIILLIPFPDSPFRLLQIASKLNCIQFLSILKR